MAQTTKIVFSTSMVSPISREPRSDFWSSQILVGFLELPNSGRIFGAPKFWSDLSSKIRILEIPILCHGQKSRFLGDKLIPPLIGNPYNGAL